MAVSPRLGAIAVLIRGHSVLLARRRNPPDAGMWGYPGGHVEAGETALAAAIRELKEETGVTAGPLGYLTNIDVIRRHSDGTLDHHYLLAAVLCRYMSGAPVPADDVIEARWLDTADVLKGNMPLSRHVDDVLSMALTDPRRGPRDAMA